MHAAAKREAGSETLPSSHTDIGIQNNMRVSRLPHVSREHIQSYFPNAPEKSRMIAVPHSCSRHSRLVEPHFPFSRLAKSSRVRRRQIPSRNSRQVRYSLPDSSHGSKTRKQDRIRMDSFQSTCWIPWSGIWNNKTPGKRCPICHMKLVSYHSGFWQIHVRL